MTRAELRIDSPAPETETMRVAYLGPEGTFTHEALTLALDEARSSSRIELVPLPTIYETVMAVQNGEVERALVPIENSLEGSVDATLDTLAMEAEDVAIVGELVHPIRHCLVARTELKLDEIEVVVSHPQANAQCARFIRTQLPGARVLAGSSTAEAVRTMSERDEPWAALGTRLAAERYGCRVLRTGVEDGPENETRFVWLARLSASAPAAVSASENEAATPDGAAGATDGAWKTSIVFWGVGSNAPGWLVACLAEFGDRGVNLTRIESRPRKQGLGSYMFFLDIEGPAAGAPVASALQGLRAHVEALRVLGSFPAT